MLDFREIDYQKDISEIVNLIKKGLDKGYTEEFFRWKHLKNPFGKSYGLVATDNGKIIGLRMFMFWKFSNINQNKNLIAIRPVDTVVDDDYRGKGLFKQLTLRGLEECKGKYDLIFNTPNENSLPGYLKMGWKEQKTIYFKVGIVFPILSRGNLNFGSLPSNMNSLNNAWETQRNDFYLRWRFGNKNYKIVNHKEAYIIYSMSKVNKQNQIVIQEVFGKKKELKELLAYLSKTERAFFVYYYDNDIVDKLFNIKFKRKKSVVIIKDDSFRIGNKIIFSLGDLEGKL